LAEGLDAGVAGLDPLLAGVRAFVETQQPGLASLAERVAAWTARANPGAPMAAAGEPLRLSATMLALASLRTEPNVRAEQAAQWALRKRWIGLDAAGRAMIAMAVLANSGKTAIPPEMLRLAPIGLLREAQAWGLATRLARRLSGGLAEAFAGASLTVAGRELVLTMRSDMAVLYTDASAKDLRVLAECLGLQPSFQSMPQGVALP
ncbi:MAG TPA: hypothetical protein VN222_13295, partial [Novosphingobium sp.]|nr:hypothetical protein [Novosphingobium sp.]